MCTIFCKQYLKVYPHVVFEDSYLSVQTIAEFFTFSERSSSTVFLHSRGSRSLDFLDFQCLTTEYGLAKEF
jgi:hypothetical protein